VRIVSLVPSWTETLVHAGAKVVGRTRFCIHPSDQIKDIAVVGGTKKVDWQKVRSLLPDIVIMDREENTKEMAEECPFPIYASHVLSMDNLPYELANLSDKLKLPELSRLSLRWQKVMGHGGPKNKLVDPPALVEWITLPATTGLPVYVIWAHPWMAAGPNTFIGSMMKWCGWPLEGKEKYPRFELSSLHGRSPIFLCSTEPFPFAKRRDVLAELPGAVAIIDGEKLSWFGLRALKYLESLVE